MRMEAEAIRIGIRSACTMGIKPIKICSDSLSIIQTLQVDGLGPPQIQDVIAEIQQQKYNLLTPDRIDQLLDHLLRLLWPSHGELWIPPVAPLEQPPSPPVQQQQKRRWKHHHLRRCSLCLPVDLFAVANVHPSWRQLHRS
ncbi:hypothetical protein QJS10_CPA01g01721 [Acorus calamus]|uniref:RNase H type-1 domain-containing protein n=1 Tax=Acorus calamus TaxID=4465 RepID=A0AAV9FQA4_ACOCL|nr:hypothetical protein QJS10_CPA01g01721 [Acorus calamus]